MEEVAKGFALVEDDEPSTRAAKACVKAVGAKVDEIQRLEATANQLHMEVSNSIGAMAPDLSAGLDFEDMTTLLRAVAELAR